MEAFGAALRAFSDLSRSFFTGLVGHSRTAGIGGRDSRAQSAAQQCCLSWDTDKLSLPQTLTGESHGASAGKWASKAVRVFFSPMVFPPLFARETSCEYICRIEDHKNEGTSINHPDY